ncbi:MAG: thermonuclease family protein [Beijerinckiaceae bacterium]
MNRPFIAGRVWTAATIASCDARVQGKATLRVSALAGLITLGLLAGPDLRLASTSRELAPVVRNTAPEILSSKGLDRVPSLGEITRSAPARRKPQLDNEPAVAAVAPAAQPSLESIEIIDAATLRTGSMIVRLAGIHMPGAEQNCRRLDGLSVSCTSRAQSYLQLLVKGKAVACDRAGFGADGVEEGRCRVGETDVAEQMVRQGWAKAADQPEERLMVAEAAAREQKLGLWRE